MKTKALATMLALLIALPSMAYDFMENGIAYLINEDDPTTVSVYKEQDPTDETGWISYVNISGPLTLPETVTHDGVTYTVTAIGYEAFQGCTGLTGQLVLPSTITKIDDWAFYKCTGLTGDLVIPNGVTYIGEGAFLECDGFESVTIPASVHKAGPGSLECRGAQTIISLIPNPFLLYGNIDPYAFIWIHSEQDYTDRQLNVPYAFLGQYQSFEPWKSFANINVIEDVNGQDDVDIDDVNIAINAILKIITDPQILADSDVNKDGTADIEDVNLIINAILGVHSNVYNPNAAIDISGYYNVDMQESTYSSTLAPDVVYTFAERAAYYGNTTQCTDIYFSKIAPSVFYCNDLTGGYYSQIRYPNQPITNMKANLLADDDGNITLLSSHRDAWQDEVLEFSDAHYDEETNTITYNLRGQYEIMHIKLYLP